MFRKKKHGMEVVALELIRSLPTTDRRNEYVVFVKDDEDDGCIQASENLEIIKVPGISYADWEQVSLPKAVKKAKVDLLHCTCNTAPLRIGVPLITTIHDVIYMESVDFSGTAYQNFGNLYRRLVVPRVARNSRKIITVSHYEKKNICERLKISDDTVEVVYNGVDSKFSVINDQKRLESARQKYKLPTDFVLFFGNTAPKKNTQGVLLAYSAYLRKQPGRALPLVITDAYPGYVEKLLQELNLEEIQNHLILLDFIPQSELPALYNLAKLFLYLSLRESFGLPILEAMACGTPVITSSVSAMPEVAGDAALLCDPKNPEEISDGVVALLNQPEHYGELVARGLDRIKEFSWDKMARKVADTYTTTLF